MQKIGFIGLGRMGKGMASNLQKKGFQLVVLDVNPAPVAELLALGASAADSVAQLAQQCSIVITMLPTALEVELGNRPAASRCTGQGTDTGGRSSGSIGGARRPGRVPFHGGRKRR